MLIFFQARFCEIWRSSAGVSTWRHSNAPGHHPYAKNTTLLMHYPAPLPQDITLPHNTPSGHHCTPQCRTTASGHTRPHTTTSGRHYSLHHQRCCNTWNAVSGHHFTSNAIKGRHFTTHHHRRTSIYPTSPSKDASVPHTTTTDHHAVIHHHLRTSLCLITTTPDIAVPFQDMTVFHKTTSDHHSVPHHCLGTSLYLVTPPYDITLFHITTRQQHHRT